MSLRLYHIADAICAQKVRLALAEKGLEWDSRIVSPEMLRSDEYLNLNPNGYVPTLLHNDHVLIESRIISEYLEDAFPAAPLMPADPWGRFRVRGWTKQVDDSLHLNIYTLSFVIVFRQARLMMSEEERAKSLPLTNPVKRSYTLALLDQGLAAPHFALALDRFLGLLDNMEATLIMTEWLAGDRYTLADCDLTPYLTRLENLGIFSRLEAHYPNVARWFSAVRARPSFKSAITDWPIARTEIEHHKRVADSVDAALAVRGKLQ